MTTLFFILKVAGLVTTAGAAIAALFRGKGLEEVELPSLIIGAPKRTERRITRGAKIAAILMVAGLVVSLLAQALEQSLNNKKAIQAQTITAKQIQNAEEQVRLARESLTKVEVQAQQSKVILSNLEQQGVVAKRSLEELSRQSAQTRAVLTNVQAQGVVARESLRRIQDQVETGRRSLAYMERLAFRFEKVAVVATYEVSSSDEDVKAAINGLAALAREGGKAASDPSIVAESQGASVSGEAYPTSVVGYVADPRTGKVRIFETNAAVTPAAPSPAAQWMSVPLGGLELVAGRLPEAARVKIKALQQFVDSPPFVLSLFSQRNQSSELTEADFTAMPVSSKVLPTLTCLPEERRLSLSWQFELPASCWQANARMASVPDLDNARVCVYFTNAPPDLFGLKPMSVKLDFDKGAVTVANFQRVPATPGLGGASGQPVAGGVKGLELERERLGVFAAVLPARERIVLGPAPPAPPTGLRIVVAQ